MSEALGLKVQVWVIRPTAEGVAVLLLKTRVARGGFWQPVTGHVKPNESVEAAAARELREETGWKVAVRGRRVGKAFEFEARGQRFREEAFVFEAESDWRTPKIDFKEHDSARWVPAADAERMLKHESNRLKLQEIIQEIERNEQ